MVAIKLHAHIHVPLRVNYNHFAHANPHTEVAPGCKEQHCRLTSDAFLLITQIINEGEVKENMLPFLQNLISSPKSHLLLISKM